MKTMIKFVYKAHGLIICTYYSKNDEDMTSLCSIREGFKKASCKSGMYIPYQRIKQITEFQGCIYLYL